MKLCESKKKCIMYVFILCLILGALSVDKIQVDSSWVSDSIGASETTIFANYDLDAQSLWSLEDILLQQPSVRPLVSVRRESMRVSLRIFTFLWSVAILQQIILLYLWRQERYLWATAESHGRIICFIHQKDGEKEEHILPVC